MASPLLALALCISMKDVRSSSLTRGCFDDHIVQVDLSAHGKLMGGMILDWDRNSVTEINHAKKRYKTGQNADLLAALKKSDLTAFKAETERATQAKAKLAGITAVPDGGGNCYRFEGTSEESPRICIDKSPRDTVEAVLRLVAATRENEKKNFPLRILGLPVLDVNLPVYLADGFIKAGYLPVSVESKDQALSFSYEINPPRPPGFGSPPGNYRKE